MKDKVTDNYPRSAVIREAIKCYSSTFQEPDANLEVEQYHQYEALLYHGSSKKGSLQLITAS